MNYVENINKPSKQERKTAMVSYEALATTLQTLKTDNPEIEIDKKQDKIKIPLIALKLLADILKAMSEGKIVSIVPIATEMTTQAAAELLGCSRPHFVKLLEKGKIPFTKIGKHRRVKFEDVMNYKKEMKEKQKSLLIKMMRDDEEAGLYDT